MSQSSSPLPPTAPLGPVQVHFDPTPPLAQHVLTLFRGPFASVRFPDLDRETLERDTHTLLRAQAEAEALESIHEHNAWARHEETMGG